MSYYAIEDKDVFTGFHRGALSGLDAIGREKVKQDRFSYYYSRERYARLLYRIPGTGIHRRREKPVCKASPGSSLHECLLRSTAQDLRAVASAADIKLPKNCRKAELVEFLNVELPKQVDVFDEAISYLGLEALTIVQKLLEGESVSMNEYSRGSDLGAFPFAFLCADGNASSWFMPQELRDAFSKVDTRRYSEHLKMHDDIARLVLTHTVLGGIVPLQDVLDSYRQLVPGDSFDEEQFLQAVRELTRDWNSMFNRWEYEGVDYIVFAAYPVSAERCDCYDFMDGSSKNYRLESIWDVQRWASLVSLHSQVLPRAGMDDLLDVSVGDYVYGLPCVQELVSFFDQHVPSNENEYEFADRAVDELICNFMFKHHALAAELRRLTRQGWYLCEGFNSAPTLTSLVVRLYQELPRWEFNGWSEVEFIDMQGYPCLIGEAPLAAEELALAS